MPLTLYKRPNGIYHIRGTVQGEHFDNSARTRDRGEAEAIRAKWEADAFKRAVYGERAVGTFADAVADYIRSGGEAAHLDPLLDEFGTMKLSEIGQPQVDKMAARRRKAKTATLLRQIYTPLLAVLNLAAYNGLCDPPRIRKPEVRSGRTAFLTPQEAEDWLDALPPYLGGLVTFYLATGCRATEALDLEWKDVSPDSHRVVFWETKADYARGVDLGLRPRKSLPDRGKGYVFRNSRGEPWHGYDAINLMLRRHRERRARAIAQGSNLPALAPAHCHLFRHTWATWAYACTRDLTFIMQSGGWRSLGMVQRYTHVGSPDLAHAVLDRKWEFSGREIPGLLQKPRKGK